MTKYTATFTNGKIITRTSDREYAQAWSSGNFETIEAAKKFASMAHRYINR